MLKLLSSNIVVRELEKSDLDKGFLDSLYSLRKPNVPKSDWYLTKNELEDIFEEVKNDPNRTTLVAEKDGKIVGTATIIIEKKFIHKGGKIGHIEDVAVHEEHQGEKIGNQIIKGLLEIANENKCYKTILDCDTKVIPFYEKLCFQHVGNEMRHDPTDSDNQS